MACPETADGRRSGIARPLNRVMRCNLGVMYERGDGVPKDLVSAYKWFNLSAAQGLELARANRSLIEKQMTHDQIAEGQRLSREWKPAP